MKPRRHLSGRIGFGALVLAALALLAGLVAGVLGHGRIERWLGRAEQAEAPQAPGTKQLWTCGMHPQVIQDQPGTCPICHMALTPVASTPQAERAAGGERKVKYWWDPMLGPSSISDRPGKSAMGMDLVPVYEDEGRSGAAVTIDPVVVQNMGVRVAEVAEGPLVRELRLFGAIHEPESAEVEINLRVGGWIERLYADVDGQPVVEGEPLFDLYSPELQIAVAELISARRSLERPEPEGDEARELAAATERKLVLLGLPPAEVERLARLDEAPDTVTFPSPITGHVKAKEVIEGAAVEPGKRALLLVDRTLMWLDVRVYEDQLPFVQVGQEVSATVQALPGRAFTGAISFIHPHLDPATRGLLVRVVLENPAMELRQGMYATAQLRSVLAPSAVLVPREAVIDSGERQVAFVAQEGGRFEPRNVRMGAVGEDGLVQVLSGLAPGERVVTSGQFLLDAESRLREAIQKHLDRGLLVQPPPPAPPAGAGTGEEESEAQPAPAEAPQEAIDAVFEAYLAITRQLGEVEPPGGEPIDAARLVSASGALAGTASGETAALARAVRDAALGLEGRALDGQREALKALGPAAVALAERAPPSRSVAERLYVVHCPMAPGTWLQATSQVANPFYAAEMKRCGERVREIAPARER